MPDDFDLGFGDPQDIVTPRKQADDEASEEEQELDQDNSEEEDDSDVESRIQSKGIPSREFNKVRREAREAREEADNLKSRLAEFEAEKNSKPPVGEAEIMQAAREMSIFPQNATEEQKQAIVSATESQLKKILALSWSGAKAPKEVQQLQQQLAEFQDKQVFNEEWEDFAETIPRLYQGSTREQLKLARTAMDELSHAPQFSDKEFEYVYWKNQDIFNDIFAKRPKKSFESRDTYIPPENDSDEDDTTPSKFQPSKMPIEKLLKLDAKLKAKAEAQDYKDGWNIKDNGNTL